MPRKIFVAGEILTAADVNTNLMDQSVMVFDDATARTTAIPTPVEGMVTYLKDTDSVDKFDGSAFVPVGIAPAILQVVQATTTSGTSTTLATFVNTASTVTITPSSATNKILLIQQAERLNHTRPTSTTQATIFTPNVSGTQLQVQASKFKDANVSGGGNSSHTSTMVVLHSPATTSPVTYTAAIRNTAAVDGAAMSGRQNFIAMEVAAL